MEININIENKNDKNYSIYINELKKISIDKKIAIITNPKVSGLHLRTLLDNLNSKELYIITIPDGEEHKNMDTIIFILERLHEHKMDRKSLLIAFGGGVVGDMTGFAASIYLRGIDFIQIPTTLLSQVDASVGGKTGVNNKFGKNLIGSFYQPKAVYCETGFLKTLQKREFSAGIAEMVKMALTFDKDFFHWLEEHDLKNEEHLIYAIKKCIQIKADIVSQDEKESGIRAVLNYGHTFAHVIENETNYSTYLHGEAVSIGIIYANFLAMKLGLLGKDEFKRIKNFLIKYDLPVSYHIKNYDKFYENFYYDKKSNNEKINFILLNHIGNYKIINNIKKEIVISTLKDGDIA